MIPSIPASSPVGLIPAVGDLLNFTNKVVVITGGGSGIGATLARRFAEAGAHVAISFHTSFEAAAKVVSEIEALGGRALAIGADVTDEDQVEHLLAKVEEGLGGLDVLINNAGIYPMACLVEMTVSEWQATLDANLKSVFLATRGAGKRMIARGRGGAVVNIASIEAENPAPAHSHYNAAKAGVVMHTRAAAQELGDHGIRVNAVSPGLIWRPGLNKDWPEGVTRYEQAAPLGRVGRPEDVADACLYLASPAARWVTGVNLRIDGGVMTSQAF